MKNTKRLFLLFALITISFHARADFTGPPAVAVYAAWAGGLVGGFLACMFLAFAFKTIVELFAKRQRKHIWFQSICMYVLLAIALYTKEETDFDYILEMNYGYEKKELFFNILYLTSLIGGCILGYFITPKKASIDKSRS